MGEWTFALIRDITVREGNPGHADLDDTLDVAHDHGGFHGDRGDARQQGAVGSALLLQLLHLQG